MVRNSAGRDWASGGARAERQTWVGRSSSVGRAKLGGPRAGAGDGVTLWPPHASSDPTWLCGDLGELLSVRAARGARPSSRQAFSRGYQTWEPEER